MFKKYFRESYGSARELPEFSISGMLGSWPEGEGVAPPAGQPEGKATFRWGPFTLERDTVYQAPSSAGGQEGERGPCPERG